MRDSFKKNSKKFALTLSAGPLGRIEASRRATKQGFSFMEVMMVVFILSVSLVVFIKVISQSINHSTESRDSIVAANLAQEGVELVKNVRDNNWAQKEESFEGLNSGCKINYNYNPSNPCSGGSETKLYLDGNGFYTHIVSGNPTKFSREIAIETLGETRVVTSYVTWENGNSSDCNVSNKCAYATITLTKWGGE